MFPTDLIKKGVEAGNSPKNDYRGILAEKREYPERFTAALVSSA